MLNMKVKKRVPKNAEGSHKFSATQRDFVKKLVSRTNIVLCLKICPLAFLDRFGRFPKAPFRAFGNSERILNKAQNALRKRSIIYNIIPYYNSGRTRPLNINRGGVLSKGGALLYVYTPL